MKILNRVRNIYRSSGIVIQEKAVALFIVNSFLFFGFLFLAVVRLSGGHLAMGFGELGMSLFLGFCVGILMRGRFRTVTLVSIAIFYLGASGLFAVRDITNVMELYALPAYFIPVLITAALLAYTMWQVLGIILLSLATEVLFFYFKILPAVQGAGLAPGISEMSVAFTLSLFSGIFTVQLFAMQQRSFRSMQEQSRLSEDRLIKLHEAVSAVSEALNVGSVLSSSAGNTLAAAEEMREHLKEMESRIGELTESAESSAEVNLGIGNARDTVRERMESQSAAISAAVEATRAILAHTEEIRREVAEKEGVIDDLIGSADESVKQAEETSRNVETIGRYTTSILEIIDVIDGIADRTNLLAMNASIEAAHAGEAGKGFAVVAEEIRKLSEETNQNSEAIRKTLEGTTVQIEKTVNQSADLKALYGKVAQEVSIIQDAIRQIDVRVKGLAGESDSISRSAGNLADVNAQVMASLSRMEGELEAGLKTQDQIHRVIRLLGDDVGLLTATADGFLSEAEAVKRIGAENREYVSTLQATMQELAEN